MIRSSFIRAWVKPKIWTRILVQALFQTMPKIKKIVTFAELLKNDTGSCLKTVPYCSLMQKEPIERYSIPVSPYCLVPFHLYRYRYVFFYKESGSVFRRPPNTGSKHCKFAKSYLILFPLKSATVELMHMNAAHFFCRPQRWKIWPFRSCLLMSSGF